MRLTLICNRRICMKKENKYGFYGYIEKTGDGEKICTDTG
jgi:hypothetical protein